MDMPICIHFHRYNLKFLFFGALVSFWSLEVNCGLDLSVCQLEMLNLFGLVTLLMPKLINNCGYFGQIVIHASFVC